MTMIQLMLMVIAFVLVMIAAAAIALLRALHDIRLFLYSLESSLICVEDMEELLTRPRPPNEANPQARADEYTSPLVRRAAQELKRRRNEATNG